jgi:hypothetical protein
VSRRRLIGRCRSIVGLRLIAARESVAGLRWVAGLRLIAGRQSIAGRLIAGCGLALGLGLLLPASASAHGIVGRADLPIPAWLFAWTAAAVMVGSFVALWALWSTPRLQRPPRKPLLRVPRVLEWLCGAVGISLFGVVVVSGLWGEQNFTSNFAPTFVYVIFWVGIPIFSAFLGDLFRPFNPWRALARLTGWLLARAGGRRGVLRVRRYPARLGRWPAAATLIGFAWLELVYPSKDDPRLLATLALAYAGVQLAGMAAFGVETWCERADGFAVYFGLMGRLAPLSWKDRWLRLRMPLSGICDLELWPGTAAVVCALIGTTSFDGFSNGEVWVQFAPSLEADLTRQFGIGALAAYEVVASVGLIFCVLFIAGMYRLGIRGMASALRGLSVPGGAPVDGAALSRTFLHTLVPIAFGYMLAHYFSLLVLDGQAMGYLISDPLGRGDDLFGTANFLINYNLISFAAIWYVQIAAIVAGHVSGLILSHERGLVVFKSSEAAVRSQYWMLAVMVGFTCLALWILSAVTTVTG